MRFFLIGLLLAGSLHLFAERKISRTEYIDLYKEIAVSEMNRTGVPASIKLAQGILESRNGNSQLARNANNHFGMKCGRTKTGYFLKDDDHDAAGNRIPSCFKIFSSVKDSYRAHSELLMRKRYRFLLKYKMDYKKWAYGLKKAGYATDPTYPQQLIQLIERHGLAQYDQKPVSKKETIPFMQRPIHRPNSWKPYLSFYNNTSGLAFPKRVILAPTSLYTWNPNVRDFPVA